MPAHPNIENALNGKRLTFTSGNGVATLTAANTTLSTQDLEDLINVAKASGHELVFSAGALKIRPANSSL